VPEDHLPSFGLLHSGRRHDIARERECAS
jgi:hypothetical protein